MPRRKAQKPAVKAAAARAGKRKIPKAKLAGVRNAAARSGARKGNAKPGKKQQAAAAKKPTSFNAGNVQVLLSFGTRGGPSDPKKNKYGGFMGYKRVMNIREEILKQDRGKYKPSNKSYCYVDSEVLGDLPGAFTDPKKPHVKGLNHYWADYYRDAVKKADIMAFLITKEWLDSPNCLEEWGWALDLRKRGSKTIAIPLDTYSANSLATSFSWFSGSGTMSPLSRGPVKNPGQSLSPAEMDSQVKDIVRNIQAAR